MSLERFVEKQMVLNILLLFLVPATAYISIIGEMITRDALSLLLFSLYLGLWAVTTGFALQTYAEMEEIKREMERKRGRRSTTPR